MQNFTEGDFLVFQVESGFGLMRILAIRRGDNGENIWHLSAFNELFLDVDFAEMALENPEGLSISNRHFVITQRAFDATQTARLSNRAVSEFERELVENWQTTPGAEPKDISARLLLGLR